MVWKELIHHKQAKTHQRLSVNYCQWLCQLANIGRRRRQSNISTVYALIREDTGASSFCIFSSKGWLCVFFGDAPKLTHLTHKEIYLPYFIRLQSSFPLSVSQWLSNKNLMPSISRICRQQLADSGISTYKGIDKAKMCSAGAALLMTTCRKTLSEIESCSSQLWDLGGQTCGMKRYNSMYLNGARKSTSIIGDSNPDIYEANKVQAMSIYSILVYISIYHIHNIYSVSYKACDILCLCHRDHPCFSATKYQPAAPSKRLFLRSLREFIANWSQFRQLGPGPHLFLGCGRHEPAIGIQTRQYMFSSSFHRLW